MPTILKFGDPKSIAYRDAKNKQNYRLYRIHECDCSHCTEPRFECPYCKSQKEPKWITDNNALAQCVECEKVGFIHSIDQMRNTDLIKTMEEEIRKELALSEKQ